MAVGAKGTEDCGMTPTPGAAPDSGLWDVRWGGRVVLIAESYTVASQVLATLRGIPGAVGEMLEVAEQIRASAKATGA